jgi:hypothetical protein
MPTEVEILRAQVKLMRECHDEAESILRSTLSIAERDGRDTNWKDFRARVRAVTDTYWVARQAFATYDKANPTETNS